VTVVHRKEAGAHRKGAGSPRKEPDVYGEDGWVWPSVVDIITDRLSRIKVVGVSWGQDDQSPRRDARRTHPRSPRGQDPIQFVPLCGEPLKDRVNPLRYSSSALAARLGEIFNGRPRKSTPPRLR
jgi:hypothetical protein